VFLRSEQNNKFHNLGDGWKKAATWLAAFFLVGAICFEMGYRFGASSLLSSKDAQASSSPSVETSSAAADSASTALEPELVSVYITGAVHRPGVYTAKPTQRIGDVIDMAGPKDDADLTRLNLASHVADEMMIYVPKVGQESVDASQGIPSNTAQNAGGVVIGSSEFAGNSKNSLININTADEKQLDALPGIGPTLAARIVEYRQANGPFKTIEEVKNVSGIGEKRFADIKDLITVR
jgi:competence protein ComEA